MTTTSENWPQGLTYDDVLLLPKRSGIKSRKDVDTETVLGNLKLKLPILSAPMDTVTESAMAIALARQGAFGVIHRFNTIEQQVLEVEKVKRKENHIIDKPLTVLPDMYLGDLLCLVEEKKNQSFLVSDNNNRLLGIISRRDYVFEKNLQKKVFELMTPVEKLITIEKNISLEEAGIFFHTHKVEKLPIVGENNKILGLITAKDVFQGANGKAARDKKGRLLVGAALGVKNDDLERAKSLVNAGVDALVLDIAHGHLESCLEQTVSLKKQFPEVTLIVGNIATASGAQDLREAGADVIKVGVGPGSACTTRIVTGFGVPQLTAVMEAKKGAGDVPIIADGGIQHSGEMVKALAAGASAVMMGSMFAGTDESPGKVSMWNGRKVKLYRGMASFGAYRDKVITSKLQEPEDFTAEGVDQGFVPYKGSVRDLLAVWEGGLRSGFSYAGAHNLVELWKNAEFIKISRAGMKESHAHDISQV